MRNIFKVLLVLLVAGCTPDQPSALSTPDAKQQVRRVALADVQPTPEQAAEIRALIEQLVFQDSEATNRPVYTPGLERASERDELSPEEYRERFVRCQEAFAKLSEYRGLAIPIMIEHLDDNRQSINFRNHFLGNSVGNACYWNIYFQLQDRPRDYSRYGYSRLGRDGEQHVKPYWDSTPFADAGGLEAWLKKHEDLSYTQMQVKCLNWLLDREKAIGAPDAESYFINILPLEIRILERKVEMGQKVQAQLDKLRRVRDENLVDEVPAELLP